jgi:hypothetical protein
VWRRLSPLCRSAGVTSRVSAYPCGMALVKKMRIRECHHLLVQQRALVFENFVGTGMYSPSFAVSGLKMVPLTTPA